MFFIKTAGYIIFLVFLFLGTLYITNSYNRNIEGIDFYYQMTPPDMDGFIVEDGLKLLNKQQFNCSIITKNTNNSIGKKYFSDEYTTYQCYKLKIYPHFGWDFGFASLRGNYVSNIFFDIINGRISIKEQNIENGNVL